MNNYLNINTFEVTQIETMETTKFNDFSEVMAHLMRSSNTTYVYGLDKLSEAFAAYFFNNGYECVQVQTGRDKLETKQFQILAFHGEDFVYRIKARKNTRVQLTVLDAKKIFGRATEEKIAASVGSDDINEGMAFALGEMIEAGHTRMTLSSNALKDLQIRVFGEKYYTLGFREYFPELSEDAHKMASEALNGGICHVNNNVIGKELSNGLTLDINSMYPSIMEQEFLPYGQPKAFTGKFVPERKYGFFIQRVKIASLSLKENGVPCIKKKAKFNEVNVGCYINDTNVELTLTNIDLQLLEENYNVEGLEYLDGYAYLAIKGKFKNFIDHWKAEKIAGQETKDEFRVMIAKSFLNNAFGKFGTKTGRLNAKYKVNRRGKVVKTADLSTPGTNSSIYAPMATFITSYGRQRLVAAIKDNFDKFVYSDTDSCHFNVSSLDELNLENIKIDSTEFGAWKLETEWTKAKFLGKKQYILERKDGSLKVVCAGMPKEIAGQISSFDMFQFGKTFDVVYTKYDVNAIAYEEKTVYELKNENIK